MRMKDIPKRSSPLFSYYILSIVQVKVKIFQYLHQRKSQVPNQFFSISYQSIYL